MGEESDEVQQDEKLNMVNDYYFKKCFRALKINSRKLKAYKRHDLLNSRAQSKMYERILNKRPKKVINEENLEDMDPELKVS